MFKYYIVTVLSTGWLYNSSLVGALPFTYVLTIKIKIYTASKVLETKDNPQRNLKIIFELKR